MAPKKKTHAPLGGNFIAQWREYRGKTQEGLAEEINLSRSGLSKIETSDSPYTQRTLEAMASSFECAPWELLAVNPKDDGNDWEGALRLSIRTAIRRGASPFDIRAVIENEAPIRPPTERVDVVREVHAHMSMHDQPLFGVAEGQLQKLDETRHKKPDEGKPGTSEKR